jgi:TRAP transporter TAXI family solute receptor
MKVFALRMGIAVAAFWLSSVPGHCREEHWPQTLAIGTGSPGGTYFVYGEALARILTRELKTTVWARPTEGPIENIKLLENNEIQLAFVTLGIAQQGWNGSADWTAGTKYRAMRAAFPMYDTPFQFVALQDSGIVSISDLGGKRIGIGPEGGTSGIYMPEVFKALKLDATLRTGSWADLTSHVQAGSVDALAVAAGVPVPSFADLERGNKVRYLPLTQNQIVSLRLAIPELGSSLVAAGTYPSLLRHYQTVGMFNFAVAHSSLPGDLVYAIVEAVFANQEEMMAVHPAAAETAPGNFTRNTFLPYHAGAAEWYHKKASVGVIQGD